MVQNGCVALKVIWIIIVSSANCISGLASGGQSSRTYLGLFIWVEDELSNCSFIIKLIQER